MVFVWGKEEQRCFEAIKALCANKLMNTHFVDGKETTMVTDASGKAICAILFQDEDMVHCMSKILNPAERRHSTTEREMMAICFGCKRFRQHLKG